MMLGAGDVGAWADRRIQIWHMGVNVIGNASSVRGRCERDTERCKSDVGGQIEGQEHRVRRERIGRKPMRKGVLIMQPNRKSNAIRPYPENMYKTHPAIMLTLPAS